MSADYVMALHPYTPQAPTYELTLRCGDRIRIVCKDPSGWWQGEKLGKVGLFPSNFTVEAPPPSPAVQRKVFPPLPEEETGGGGGPLTDQSYTMGGPTHEERTSVMDQIKVATSLHEVELLERQLKAYYPSDKRSATEAMEAALIAAAEAAEISPEFNENAVASSDPSSLVYPSAPSPYAYYQQQQQQPQHPYYQQQQPQQQQQYGYFHSPQPVNYDPYYSSSAAPPPAAGNFPSYGNETTYGYYGRPSPDPYQTFVQPQQQLLQQQQQQLLIQQQQLILQQQQQLLLPQQQQMFQPQPDSSWETAPSNISGGTLECRHWLRGFCRMGPACRFSHAGPRGVGGTPSPQICRYHLKGFCASGSNCGFTHVEPSEAAALAASDSAKPLAVGFASFTARSECRMHQQGQCRLGANCPFSHDKADGVSPAMSSEQTTLEAAALPTPASET